MDFPHKPDLKLPLTEVISDMCGSNHVGRKWKLWKAYKIILYLIPVCELHTQYVQRIDLCTDVYVRITLLSLSLKLRCKLTWSDQLYCKPIIYLEHCYSVLYAFYFMQQILNLRSTTYNLGEPFFFLCKLFYTSIYIYIYNQHLL